MDGERDRGGPGAPAYVETGAQTETGQRVAAAAATAGGEERGGAPGPEGGEATHDGVSAEDEPRQPPVLQARAPEPEHTRELEQLRQSIDEVDDQIIDLLNRRADLAQRVGAVKARAAMRMYAPDRERQLLDRLATKSRGPLPEESLRLIYKEIISAALALESPLQVAYLGPEATFTHEATKRHFGLSARLMPCRTIPDVFHDVESGRCAYGVVPIENTNDGVVIHTLDMFVSSELTICDEVLFRVSYHLLTRTGETTKVTKVYSHPQAIEQCRAWLDGNLPGVPIVDVPNTARAAHLAAEDPTAAAVAGDLAASLYGLRIAASNLEDLGRNITRFLVIGREAREPSAHDRTSVMFALNDSPGLLYRALKSFADRGINMSRIESRPSHRAAWEYLFFVDLEGHRADPHVADAVQELSGICAFMKVLGSYPQGRLAGRPVARKAR